jgi:two-component system sensor histidine kinase SenX3
MPADRSLLAIRKELETRDALLAAMSEGLLLFDPAGALVYANPAADELLERAAADATVSGSPGLRDLLAGSDAAAMREPATRQVELAGRVIETTAYASRPEGSVAVVMRDVTGARGLERLQRDFVANASHELKTPIASILVLVETLRAAEADSAMRARLLTRLDQEALRMTSLVRDLLALSRLEGGPRSSISLDFRRVVEAETARIRSAAAAARLRMDLDLGSDDAVITGSSSDLARMVHNLLDNAVRYTTGGGVITVTLRRSGNAFELAVADTGVGIPAEDLTRVFERFYRVDAARDRSSGGTGLGLSIVRSVAQTHGGDVEVASRLGDGSTFTVRLPAPDTPADRRATARRGSGSRDREP